jgi:Fic family protein
VLLLLMFVIAHNKIFYRRCALFLPSFPVHTIKFILSNWVGGTNPSNASFVPPPPQEVLHHISELEKFLHNDKSTPSLIKAGLAHAQFETIHPFLDGNGRIGRLLITFILCHDKVLEKPLLYLSLYFKQYRDEYYERLNAIRRDGDWEGWIKFYLQGIYEISTQATKEVK